MSTIPPTIKKTYGNLLQIRSCITNTAQISQHLQTLAGIQFQHRLGTTDYVKGATALPHDVTIKLQVATRLLNIILQSWAPFESVTNTCLEYYVPDKN